MDAGNLNRTSLDTQPFINLGKATKLTPVEVAEGASSGFGDLLKSALNAVNQKQQDANTLRTQVETGESNDLMGAMLAGQKAGLAFQALVHA